MPEAADGAAGAPNGSKGGLIRMAGTDAQGTDAQGTDAQGTDAQGTDAQGTDAQGIDMSGNKYDARGMYFHSQKFAGATLNGKPVCLWLVEGELIALPKTTREYQCSTTPPTSKTLGVIRGEKLVGLEVFADEFLPDGSMGLTNIRYHVDKIIPEYWPLPKSFTGGFYYTGTTYLYVLELQHTDGTWGNACKSGSDGFTGAIPTAGYWNYRGTKLASSTYFTFGCTSGVIAKCYRWGYRPWLNSAFWNEHAACTRMARADYCGDGYSWTKTGTTINHWDRMTPVRVQEQAPEDEWNEIGGFYFESAWNTNGARCFAHYRWYDLPEGFAKDRCPDQLRPPGYVMPPDRQCKDREDPDCKPTICDSEAEAVAKYPSVLHFDKSKCNGSVSGSCP